MIQCKFPRSHQIIPKTYNPNRPTAREEEKKKIIRKDKNTDWERQCEQIEKPEIKSKEKVKHLQRWVFPVGPSNLVFQGNKSENLKEHLWISLEI